MDIIEPHTYPASIGAAVSAMDVSTYRKPGMFGEFGPAGGSAENAKTARQPSGGGNRKSWTLMYQMP